MAEQRGLLHFAKLVWPAIYIAALSTLSAIVFYFISALAFLELRALFDLQVGGSAGDIVKTGIIPFVFYYGRYFFEFSFWPNVTGLLFISLWANDNKIKGTPENQRSIYLWGPLYGLVILTISIVRVVSAGYFRRQGAYLAGLWELKNGTMVLMLLLLPAAIFAGIVAVNFVSNKWTQSQ